MVEVTLDNLNTFRQTNRLICAEALRRGFSVTVPVLGSPLITIQHEKRTEIHVYSSAVAGNSYEASMQADNKYASYSAFVEANLPVIPTMLANKGDDAGVIKIALSWPTGIVVKPLDASHGDGITTGINDKATLLKALDKAYDFSVSKKTALVQQMYNGAIDLRLLCINYKFIASVRRIPARVFGDGSSSIRQLIVKANTSADRGERYMARLAYISIPEAYEYVSAKNNLEQIPNNGVEVTVLGTANYGSGGETESNTDKLPAWLVEMAEKAARISRLPLCGVDILVCDLPQPDSSIATLNPIINEINKCPSLYIHEYPTNNAGTNVVDTYFKYLLSPQKPGY